MRRESNFASLRSTSSLGPRRSGHGPASPESTWWTPLLAQASTETAARGRQSSSLDRARDVALEGRNYEIVPILVEEKASTLRSLSALCGQYTDLETHPIHGDFWQRVDDVASLVGGAPYLLLVDPFGIKGLDYQKLARLANTSSRCDLIVTFVESAVPRLESQYRDAIALAVGPRAPADRSAAETFARNLAEAAGFLPAGRFEIRQSFDSAKAYELIVFSRSPHAYRLWNDFMADEWNRQLSQRRSRGASEMQHRLSGFDEAEAEAGGREALIRAANRILDWLCEMPGRPCTRETIYDHFAVSRFCEFHSSTLGHALRYLEDLGRVRRERGAPPRIDTDLWLLVDATYVR